MEITTTAYISLGGNMGNEAERFARALTVMAGWQGIHVAATSKIYRTEPQGDTKQPWFKNQVAALRCASTIKPMDLLSDMLRLEQELGRVRDADRKLGPRTIDLDLLLFGDVVCMEENLCLPHPRMAERAFVLVPLDEIAPSLQFPGGSSVASLLKKLQFCIKEQTIFQSKKRDTMHRGCTLNNTTHSKEIPS